MLIQRGLQGLIPLLALLLVTSSSVLAQTTMTHVVQPGDTLFRIALRYGVEMATLAEANQIGNMTRIYVGQELIIPGTDAPETGEEIANPLVAAAPIIHRVERAENLGAIAQKYGVTIQEILDANNIANINLIYPGQELQIWAPDIGIVTSQDTSQASTAEAEISSTTETVTHIVQRGEFLARIARVYGVNWQTIAEANGIVDPNRITPGMSLIIPNAITTTTSVVPTPTPEPAPSVVHTVQQGEHLSQIAQQYGVRWQSIAEANGLTDPNHVTAGTQLVIPGVEGTSSSRIIGIVENVLAANAPGPKVGAGRELVVRLSTQTAYAYEDGNLIKASVVSTGLPVTPTVQGSYKIYLKYSSQTMSGPGYYLPGVQWVMYFYRGYAFHGTYWHNNFGQPMSRGCVNMTNDDARFFYDFASIGTPVTVFY